MIDPDDLTTSSGPLATGFLLAGTWHVDPARNRITGPDGEHRVPDKFMQVLVYLAEHPGVVGRQALMDALWPGAVVVDEALTRAISELRKILGDDPRRPRFIETIPKKGYRLVCGVEPEESAPGPVDPPRSTPSTSSPTPRAAGDTAPRYSHRSLTLISLSLVVVLAVGWWLLARSVRPGWGPTESLAFTSLPGVEEYPALSPAGDRLAYAWEGDAHEPTGVFVKVVGEPEALRLAGGGGHFAYPAWSHDSRYVAFSRVRGDPPGIFTVPATGGQERQLIGEVHGEVPLAADFSPDGVFLVFAAPTEPGTRWGIHRLSLASNVREVLAAPEQPGHFDFRPRYSPDGRWIACIRSRSEGMSVALIPSAGGDIRTLPAGDRVLLDLDWTPDGKAIVFTADDGLWEQPVRGGEPRLVSAGNTLTCLSTAREIRLLAYTEARGDWNIWALPLGDGAQPVRLIGSSRFDARPAQSHDDRRIAFVSDRSGEGQIWVAAADGSAARRVTDLEGGYPDHPAWSPDDRRLAFTAVLDGHRRICLLNMDTEDFVVLSPPGRHEILPTWSQDGRWIYFTCQDQGMSQVCRRSVAGGALESVTKGGGYLARETLDGARILFSRGPRDTTGIWRLGVGGGVEEQVCELPGRQVVDWGLGPDGIYVLSCERDESQSYRLDRCEAATGRLVPLAELESRRGFRVDVHPVSGRVLFDRTERLESDLVGLRNF